MSIRKRLITFIFLMVGFLILMGGVLQLGGPLIVGAFRQSLDAMGSLNAIREFKTSLNHEKTSLNRYLLLADSGDLLEFNEISPVSASHLGQIVNTLKRTESDAVQHIQSEYGGLHAEALKIVDQYRSGQKTRAHEKWISKTFPRLQQLENEVSQLEARKSEEAQVMFEKIKDISRLIGIVVSIVFVIAIGAGILLFRSLYQGVMTPLEQLRKGADKFGKGKFDHRIDIPSKNEFGTLAESFNKMAENVKQLQLQAVHMDRMSAVGQLAGGVAHEINNPLTAVLGQTQILLAKTNKDDKSYVPLTKIENAAIRCRKIVRGLLDFSRPSQKTQERIDVSNLIHGTLDLCEADLKKSRIAIDKNIIKNLPQIKGNASELQQVLLNLINNAIQAMQKGGILQFNTKVYEAMPPIIKNGSRSTDVVKGPWVEIAVKDSGVGINPDHLSRVFEPFFTTKEIGKGTGLGLSVSMGIVKRHGGDLRVESEGKNRGTTFRLFLPAGGPSLSKVMS